MRFLHFAVLAIFVIEFIAAIPLEKHHSAQPEYKKTPVCWKKAKRCEVDSDCSSNGECSVCYNQHRGKKGSGVCGLPEHKIPADSAAPQQIHIAQGADPTSITVSWVTELEAKPVAQIRAGDSKSWDAASGKTTNYTSYCRGEKTAQYTYASGYIHHVQIKNLKPDTQYFYRVGDDSQDQGLSEEISFTTLPAVGDLKEPLSFAVIGDLGQTADSESTVRHILSDGSIRAILHAGDMSYSDCDHRRWDSWGKMVQPLAATKPYMVCAGNHEIETDPVQKVTFLGYKNRFAMPEYKETVDTTTEFSTGCAPSDYVGHYDFGNSYYSFDYSQVHVIVLNSYSSAEPGSNQYNWLVSDLAAVNRKVTPWIIAMMHGPWYNTNTAHHNEKMTLNMKASMEKLFFEHRVNLVFAGHVHAYERTYEVYDNVTYQHGGAPVYVVTGDGGNREGHSDVYFPSASWTAFRNGDKYGHSKVTIINSTVASFEWRSNEDEVIEQVDQTWIFNNPEAWGVVADDRS